MEKSTIALIPTGAIAAFSIGWYGGREYYEHHQIADAVADLGAAKSLPNGEADGRTPISERIDGKLTEVFGNEPQVRQQYVNRDGVIVREKNENISLTDYDTIVGHFRTEAREVVDGQGDFAMMSGEIGLGVFALAGAALAIRHFRKNRSEHEQADGEPKQKGFIRRKLGSLMTLGASKHEGYAEEEEVPREELVGAQ
jgi:hypothetical protein